MNQVAFVSTHTNVPAPPMMVAAWPRVEDHLDLVTSEARRMARRLPGHITSGDLVGSACMGLMAAVTRFSPSHGCAFPSFARLKIRAAMLDELRDMDMLPRRTRASLNRLERSRHKLVGLLGREPTRAELAADSGLPEAAVEDVLCMGECARPAEPLDALETLCLDRGSVVASAEQRDAVALLSRAIGSLGTRHQQVLNAYYKQDLTFKEIGQQWGVTESRICQLHAEAVKALRKSFPDA